MTEIDKTVRDTSRRSGVGTAKSRYSRLNDRCSYILTILLLLMAIPQASMPPPWWLAFCVLIFMLSAYYLIHGHLVGPNRPLKIKNNLTIFIIVAPIPVFSLLQTLPLGHYIPSSLLWYPTHVDAPSTISIAPGVTYLGAIRLLAIIALFFLALEISTQKSRVERMGWLLFGGVVAHAVWALIALRVLGDISLWGEKTAGIGSATGTFVNRNSFATFIGFGLILGVSLTYERARSSFQEIGHKRNYIVNYAEIALLLLACLVIVFALIATGSRMGVFATVIGVIVTVIILRWSSMKISFTRAAAEAAVGSLLLISIGLIAVGQNIMERSIFSAVDLSLRSGIYNGAFNMISARPWLGWGFDAFAAGHEILRTPNFQTHLVFELAHSTYLTFWIELGVIVGSLWIIAGFVLAFKLLRGILVSHGKGQSMQAASLGVLSLGAVHSTLDFSLEIPANAAFLVVVVGLGVGLTSNQRQRRDESDPN